MDGGKPVPFTLWSEPKDGHVMGRSTTGLWDDIEWTEDPGSNAMWIQADE